MATETNIANKALAHVGSARITDFNDPDQVRARTIRDVWTLSRQLLLHAANWTSHRTRASLSTLTAAPISGWANQFQLPSDFLRIAEFNRVDVFDEPLQEFFQIEGKQLLTDEDSASIVYIRDDEDTSLLSPAMVECMALLVGSAIATPIREDEQLAAVLYDRYKNDQLPEARRISAINKKVRRWRPEQDSRLVQARSYNSMDVTPNG